MADRVCDLLRQLWDLNKKDGIRQSRSEPSDPPDDIVTLDAARTMRLSPMLRERYAFAGRWRKAALDQTWLDLDAIDAAVIETCMSREAHAQTASRTLPWAITEAQVTLFGINDDTREATYLIWLPDREEPAICAFYGGRSDLFSDLGRFLEFLVGDRVHDDTVELAARAVPEAARMVSRQTA
ncbi:hypothetical protein [Methylobacterium sp. SyP6R]|uniref:hypothetical protein n=1 Tax=Methylobacterium sp. SyP6R TaxID=2718876 RepID=UPI001F3E203A|nr:hypothetical protein [Methylobacterium sp. SyP6R]MCF4130195.1 hypothetical protein [Methylobacterium sp. SyP6R]